MLSTVNLTDVLEIVVVIFGVILLLKKIVDMDEYHWARVAVLTVILSIGVILLFSGLGVRLGNSGLSNCVVDFGPPSDHY
jgi:hypothetical protein